MEPMSRTGVTRIDDYEDRGRRLKRAVAARRRLHAEKGRERRIKPRRGGRVWVNGSELGGTELRHAHLAVQYD